MISVAPSVLLIGAEPYLIRACTELGVELVVVYGPNARDDDEVAVPDQVRTIFVQDQRTPESVLTALHRAGLADRHFDAVMTFNEHALVHAAVLARLFGCRGMAPEIAVRFRDKWLQKRVIREAGLRTARSTLIDDVAYTDDLPEIDSWPRVLKPVYGVGAALTAKVSDAGELREAAARFYRMAPRYRIYVAEEYITGDEWIADGVVFHGEILFLSVATYGEPCLSALSKKAAITYRRFNPDTESEAFAIADPFVRRCIAALGLTDGVFHMELFHNPDTGELVFGECNGRRGAAQIPEEVRCKFNVDLGEEGLRCALGWTPRLDVKISPDSIGNTYLYGPPGVLLSCPSPSEVLAREGTRYVDIERPVGSVVPEVIGDTSTRIGQVVLAAPTPGDLYRRMAATRDWFASRLIVVPPGASLRTLRAWHRQTWPGAGLDPVRYEEPPAGC